MKKLPENYRVIHFWLSKKYGKASHCENPNCLRKSFNYNWALLKGKEYEFKRENFIQLCRSCHILYDRDEFTISKIRIRMLGKKHTDKHNENISKSLKGTINWNLIKAGAKAHIGKPAWNKNKKFQWINNGIIEKQIPLEQNIPKEFKKGRI